MNMHFDEMSLSSVPSFGTIQARTASLYPDFHPLKAGYEFDYEKYRIYFSNKDGHRVPVDIRENLLKDLVDNHSGSNSSYTRELLVQLDELILVSFGRAANQNEPCVPLATGS